MEYKFTIEIDMGVSCPRYVEKSDVICGESDNQAYENLMGFAQRTAYEHLNGTGREKTRVEVLSLRNLSHGREVDLPLEETVFGVPIIQKEAQQDSS